MLRPGRVAYELCSSESILFIEFLLIDSLSSYSRGFVDLVNLASQRRSTKSHETVLRYQE